MVAHKILETAQSPNSLFPFLIWGWDYELGLGLELDNKVVDIRADSDSGNGLGVKLVHNANATLSSFLSLLLNFI